MQRMEAQNIDSKFRLILLASDRAERLLLGARPKITQGSTKLARRALEEVLEGMVDWQYGPAPEREIEEFDEAAVAEASGTAAE